MIKICLSIPFDHKAARGFSLEELFVFAKKVGFDGIEYLASFQDLFRNPTHVLELSKKYSLPVLSMHQPIYLVFYSPSFLFPRMVNLARYFPDLLVTNNHLSSTFPPFTSSPVTTKMLYNMGNKKKITVTFESNPVRSYLFLYPKITHDPIAYGNFCVKNKLPITMDVSHIANHNFSLVDFFTAYHKQIALIHLSDYKDNIEHLPLTKGKLPIKEFFFAIKKAKWNGVITFETGNFLHMKTKEEKLRATSESLAFVRNLL